MVPYAIDLASLNRTLRDPMIAMMVNRRGPLVTLHQSQAHIDVSDALDTTKTCSTSLTRAC